jgi:manganese efflux pump family protein
MSFGAILLLALGVSMDAAAVSAALGQATPRILPRHVFLVAAFFGSFQVLMPLIGWLVGSRIGPLVEAWDHWLAFCLLGGIGAKMLWEAGGEKSEGVQKDPFALQVMIWLALATSIDALAIGVTLPIFDAPLFLSLVSIGFVTAVMSAAGLFAGRHFGSMLGRRLDIVGGLVLIGLGLKILIEHLRVIE